MTSSDPFQISLGNTFKAGAFTETQRKEKETPSAADNNNIEPGKNGISPGLQNAELQINEARCSQTYAAETLETQMQQACQAQSNAARLLSIEEAARVLGMSTRAIERSLLGRWGNKLPEGWKAKKVKVQGSDQWRIIPPAGIRLSGLAQESVGESAQKQSRAAYCHDGLDSFQGNSMALKSKRTTYRLETGLEQATIVIDRSEELEHLLRELLATQKTLSEERRLHMEDLRMVAQLQGSMRLLENNAAENARAKAELENTKVKYEQLQGEYNELLSLPWWKRIFAFRQKKF